MKIKDNNYIFLCQSEKIAWSLSLRGMKKILSIFKLTKYLIEID